MSSTEDKVKGNTNEAVGKIKQGVGEATDNERMKGEGKRQEAKGEAQQVKGDVKDTLKKGIDKASSADVLAAVQMKMPASLRAFFCLESAGDQRSRYCSLSFTPSHSSASARASFFSVMFGQTSARSALSSMNSC